MAEYGKGSDIDYNAAYEYYKEAANAGYGKAAGAIGDMYYFGRVGKNTEGNQNTEYTMMRWLQINWMMQMRSNGL